MVYTLGQLFTQWQSIGVFDLLLPFLFIFAVVFGILQTTRILGHNKGIITLIAVVIGLMALRWNYLSLFFADMFPRLGIGIAVIVAILILVGLFIPVDESRYWGWGLGALGVVIFIIIITRSFENTGFGGFYGGAEQYAGWIVGAVLILGLVIAVATSGSKSSGDHKEKGPAKFAFVRSEE